MNGKVSDVIEQPGAPTRIRGSEFSYSPEDFNLVRQTLYRISGIRLAETKDAMVYSRLVRRIRALRHKSFSDYLSYLKRTPAEQQHFINALTTNLTSFFREPHHFSMLANHLAVSPQVKTIWCAASSSGEEPYSIAMTVAEHFGHFDVPVKIIASDIDSNMLEKARAGIYPEQITRQLSPERCKHFLHRGKKHQAGSVRIVPELRKMVEFRHINLTEPRWPLPRQIDVIFCRNVMIYFDKQTQLRLLEKMVSFMPAQGLYFAGHSENFSMAPHLVRPVGNTTYQPAKGKSYG
ncbi:chemotaxis protein CheR [Salinimonas sp. HHU 13199]|uniref:Chemotaxis protein methyltransferase n=1 Tax=Salinimonas profundi TaxID=2729140 RepID=A0ABR8LJA2_9ALTE|nr:CheR family methyltransferase [Salinimonas profundi]MBD3586292.1 chemotaxis protein CheR [Salinimonas profundi]